MPTKKTTKKTPAKKSLAKKAGSKPAKAGEAPNVKPATKKEVAVKSPAKPAKGTKRMTGEKAIVAKAPTKKAEKKKAPAKKVAVKKARKSSLVATPPPPPKRKPKFVPPKDDRPINKPLTGTHSDKFIETQRQNLLDLRETLLNAMNGVTRDTIRNAPEGSDASGSGQHQGDAGSDAYDRDFALSVLAKEQDALYEIDQALMRIKAGSYGVCEISGQKIPQMRLEAIPFARLTVECQTDWEKEYGNRRFRPSTEVGFSGGMREEDENSVTVSLDGDDD